MTVNRWHLDHAGNLRLGPALGRHPVYADDLVAGRQSAVPACGSVVENLDDVDARAVRSPAPYADPHEVLVVLL